MLPNTGLLENNELLKASWKKHDSLLQGIDSGPRTGNPKNIEGIY